MTIELTFTQCKQIKANGHELIDIISEMNEQPEWITRELSITDILAVQQGGCASGAYMPAVTYHSAVQIMSDHGDDVLEFIENILGVLPEVPKGESWCGIAVFYLSHAVELWCSNFDLEGVDWD